MAIKLQAELRKNSSVNQLRNSGFVPGVVYGRGVENVNVTVDRTALERLLKEAGENALLELEVKGDKSHNVLIHDIQREQIKDVLNHVDFLEVRLDQKVKAEIPLVFIGESPAIKELNGTLVKNIQHVEVEALPQNLPHNIEVDISSLATFEEHISIADIKIGPNVKIVSEPDVIVASVVPPRSEEELEALKGEVVEDVSKVEGVVKEEPVAEGEEREGKKEEKAEVKEKGEK